MFVKQFCAAIRPNMFQKLCRIPFLLLFPLLFFGCSTPQETMPAVIIEPNLNIDDSATLPVVADDFAQGLVFDPQSAEYFDLVNEAMVLNEAEITMLAQNGFVISDRLHWTMFVEAYGWIYKNDLPVVVTSDSILHAVHQSYSNLLQQIEVDVIHPELEGMLTSIRDRVLRDAKKVPDASLAVLYQDVADYLTVAIVLASGEAVNFNGEPYTHEQHGEFGPNWGPVTLEFSQIDDKYKSEHVQELVQLAWEANTATDLNDSNPVELTLFNNSQSIDFTQFQPRAHYNNSLQLSHYFRAMTWLAQADFRFVEFDPLTSEPILNLDSVVAAKILQTAVNNSGQRQRWSSINAVFTQLVGESDNTTLPDFERLSYDMGWSRPKDVMKANPDQLLNQLLVHDYGQQRITGQLLGRHIDNDSIEPIARPISFMLMGQRFALDSWIMSNVVYDRVMFEGRPVERPLPTGFDVMAALGNDRAITHLQSELELYPYEPALATLRQRVDEMEPDFWQAPIYNQWLNMIRSLNAPTTGEQYPEVMKTAVWADKTLQTQLSSWAQLRHDNLLYVKQSYTMGQILCEFPSVYVEPYPDLYQALHEFAQNGLALTGLVENNFTSEVETLRSYFTNVADSALMLAAISEKELNGTPLTAEEQMFLKSIVIAKEYNPGCGGVPMRDKWDGWYVNMLYGEDESPALIADVHTNPTNDPRSSLYPPRVLHVGTGPAAAMFMIVETADGPQLHVGPAFTYYEFAEEGFPPVRFNDEQWQGSFSQPDSYPDAPDWVTSFRIPTSEPGMPLFVRRD